MKKIKEASVAGKFYSYNKIELIENISNIKNKINKVYKDSTRGLIVPHAGHIYSADIALMGYQYLDDSTRTLFIFAPSHNKYFEGLITSSYDSWRTPLGDIDLDLDIIKKLTSEFGVKYLDEPFNNEHSIEVQLPLIQMLRSNIKIVPILIGNVDYTKISTIIKEFWSNKSTSFIISSDLSHFYKDNEAKMLDALTAEFIENKDINSFHEKQACGLRGILALINFASDMNFNLIRISMKNSSEVNNNKNQVVGYGSWLLTEKSTNEFIKDNFSYLLLDIAKESISSRFKLITTSEFKPDISKYAGVLQEKGASFVTLTLNKQLRGCIGSIIAYRSLIEDISINAYNSAFNDTRFTPLTEEEYNLIKISISLLSPPVKLDFKDENDLLAKITKDKDGLIIRDKNYKAVYLPSVWEYFEDKQSFLNSLKQKAGLSSHYFSNTFEAFSFETITIEEKNYDN